MHNGWRDPDLTAMFALVCMVSNFGFPENLAEFAFLGWLVGIEDNEEFPHRERDLPSGLVEVLNYF